MNLKDLKIDDSWTLFLDRDGVINKRLVDEYVTCWEDFEFIPGAFEALKLFSGIFGRIFIITNQQGIGKGLMTEKCLKDIHSKMVEKITENGGRIDHIYYSPYLKEENNFLRKPNIGMALKAKIDFEEIDFKKSIMVGDSITDLQFGKRKKMQTVFISDDLDLISENYKLINFTFSDLIEFAKNCKIYI